MALEEERKVEALKCPKCDGKFLDRSSSKVDSPADELICGKCGFTLGVDKLVSLMKFEKENIESILGGTKELFSKLTDKNINIYDSDEPTVSEDTRRKQISVGVDMDNPAVKTDFERFMAQLIYNSPNASMSRRTAKMVRELDDKRKGVGKKLAMKIYQLFECRRIESNFGENYSGALNRFKQARQDRQARVLIKKGLVDGLGNKQMGKLNDPFTALELAEVNYDLTGTDYEFANEIMKQAEGGLGRSGAIQLAKEYWYKYGLDWIKKLTLPPVPPVGKGGDGDPEEQDPEDGEDGEQKPEDGQTGGCGGFPMPKDPNEDDEEQDEDGEEQDGDDEDGEDGEGGCGTNVNPKGQESDDEETNGQSGSGQGGENSENEDEDSDEDSDEDGEGQDGEGQDGNGDPVNGNPTSQEGQKKGKDYEQKDDRPWRKKKMSYAQEKYLDSLGLPETSKYPEMTQGEASDLIEKWKEMQKEQKKMEQELADAKEDKELDRDQAMRDIEAWREMEKKAEVNKIIKNLQNYKGKEKLKMTNSLSASKKQGAKEIEAVDDLILSKGVLDMVNQQPNFDDAIRSCWLAEIDNIEPFVELEAIDIDKALVKKMSRFFKKFKGKKKEILDEEGSDMDIDALIDDYFKPQKLCFRETEIKKGLDVVIAYDQSASMGGAPIQIVRNMVATLMKSMEKSPKIDVKALGWCSSYNRSGSGGSVRIEEIKDWKQVTKIGTYGSTPMTESIVFAKNYLDTKMKGDKKLLFVITDGGPNGSAWLKAAQKSIRDLRAKKGIVIGIRIGSGGYNVDKVMTEYFGKNGYVVFDGAEEMSKFIKTKVKKLAMRYLN